MQHGTVAGYSAKCRCAECRAAINEYSRKRRREGLDRTVPGSCQRCGTSFMAPPSQRARKFCSQKCSRTEPGSGRRAHVTRRGHPLAAIDDGRIMLHRLVLFEKIGPGVHPCHWCGTSVTWHRRVALRGDLVSDHLNGNTRDNSPENLVPSCTRCNALRGKLIAWAQETGSPPETLMTF